MTETPICEHCKQPLKQVFARTETIQTYYPETNSYMNTERNWDYYGDTVAICTGCSKITESVTFTEDGRLIPKVTEITECPHLWLQWMHHDHAVKCLVCGAKIPPQWDGWD